ncbi:MAG: toprim domain-containing protein [Prevotellaceae bacterium]|nr:toprim domain-containing protein [Prevotellaceae bacterium]
MSVNYVDKILDRTNRGLDVFVHYLGDDCMKKIFRNPYREDARPSCHLYVHRGSSGDHYWLQDFGDSSWSGDCFDFVARLAGINAKTDFRKVLETIDRDLRLGLMDGGDDETALGAPRRYDVRKMVRVSRPVIMFVPVFKDFTPAELNYWRTYGIRKDTLDRFHVRSLARCDFVRDDRSRYSVISSVYTPTFGYMFGDKGIKIYRPRNKTRFLYGGQLPKPYIFGLGQLPQTGSRVFITGGEKDVMTLSAHGFPAIAFNSETAAIPEDIILDLAYRFDRIILLYDSDETGIRESEKVAKEYGDRYPVRRLQLPLPGTKQSKDISDFFKEGHTGSELLHLLKTQEM